MKSDRGMLVPTKGGDLNLMQKLRGKHIEQHRINGSSGASLEVTSKQDRIIKEKGGSKVKGVRQQLLVPLEDGIIRRGP